MNWKIIFNPFSKFSEIQLLIFGVLITFLGSFIGSHFGVIFDGVFDVHVYEISIIKGILVNLINVFSVFILFLILGKIINSKTRIIDILNVSLISRLPIYLVGIFANNSKMNSITEDLMKGINEPEKLNLPTADLIFIMIFSSTMMIFLIYSIVLMVFGFKTATNIKKWQHYVFFAIAIVAAEIISKILISNIIL
jgi:hypothetical protein